jgi:hypothetical protein
MKSSIYAASMFSSQQPITLEKPRFIYGKKSEGSQDTSDLETAIESKLGTKNLMRTLGKPVQYKNTNAQQQAQLEEQDKKEQKSKVQLSNECKQQ